MNVCVYCSSSNGVDDRYLEAASRLGVMLAERKFTLIYGGGGIGLMGKVADAAHGNGGRVIGVIPELLNGKGITYPFNDELVVTGTMRERKEIMEQRADGFIGLPGGFGTLEELLEIITLKQLKYLDKPVAIVNIHGFFEPLEKMFEKMYAGRFTGTEYSALYRFTSDVDEALSYIESYAPVEIPDKWKMHREA